MFSVIIPTCHRNADLALCLDCLAPGEQSLLSEAYEVIVTDDGRDSTAEAMIRDRYPWAKWTQGPRRGPAANRNHGARQAQGEWLVFTDDDCLPTREWLSAFADSVNAADVLEGLTRADRERKSYAEEAPINLTGGYLWSCNFAIKKNVFEAVGGFDEKFPAPAMEDCDLRENLREAGIPLLFIESAVVIHPWRQARGWSFNEKQLSSLLYFYDKHPNLRPRWVGCSYALNGLRIFKGNVLHNFSSIGFSGISYGISHLFWNLWTAARLSLGYKR
jgi:GT2 family glycosyltransferase